jgi:aryl-alcohol dehydrogenase-like predicted oxidoreductase
VELELVPALRAPGLGLIPYSPLHAGLLAGALESGGQDPRDERHRDRLEAYEELCRQLGAKPQASWLDQAEIYFCVLHRAAHEQALQQPLAA